MGWVRSEFDSRHPEIFSQLIMNNNQTWFIVVVLILVLIFGFFWWSSKQAAAPTISEPAGQSSVVPRQDGVSATEQAITTPPAPSSPNPFENAYQNPFE